MMPGLGRVDGRDVTGWRLYTGWPDPAVLKAAMAEVPGGGARPLFRRSAAGKVAFSV